MEQGRLFLAIVLSFLVFIVWEFMFAEKQSPVPPVAPGTVTESSVPAPLAEVEKKETPLDPEAATEERITTPGHFFGSLTIHTPLYSTVISEKGAGITRFTLHQYRESVEKSAPDKELISADNPMGTGFAHLSATPVTRFTRAVFTTTHRENTLQLNTEPASVSFFWHSPEGILVEKKFTFLPDSYEIKMDVILTNTADTLVKDTLQVSMIDAAPHDKRQFSFEGPFAFVNGKLEEVAVKDIDEKNTLTGQVQWAGLTDQYFMSAVLPGDGLGNAADTPENTPENSGSVRLAALEPENLIQVTYVNSPAALSPGASTQYFHSLYIGPRKIDALKAVGHHLDKAVNFGFFDFIAKPCLWLMNGIHDHMVPNYGIAIILLTILFKLIFWPLGSKSYKSMAEMKRLQPLMAEIRQKHKNDKKKMNEEIMGLYRTYKVNPMSGCLPMVVQIPVFFAFYRMLYGSIELRHAPFFGWINDLSAPDRLFSFDVTIPLMAPPYGIPVLTIIMGATMFLQQKLSPPPGDPAQARFMMLMPLIFTFIFINFPAGLVLYWLVNNVLSISQQYYITQKTL